MSGTSRHHIYLIPGFFGFTHIGEMAYWGHVHDLLQARFERDPHREVRLTMVPTAPTASLRVRAERLMRTIAESAPAPDEALHLFGHSSGGLDARLLSAHNSPWRQDSRRAELLDRLQSVVTVATPHRGTPLASLFNSLLGQQLLQVLSLATIHIIRFGDIPLSIIFKLAGMLAVSDGRFGLSRTMLDQLFEQLLTDFTPERQGQIQSFFREVEGDQALLAQLTPESMDLFDVAAQPPPPGVRCGSVVTRARRPGVRTTLSVGADPYAQAMHTLYHAIYRLTEGMPPERLERGPAPWRAALERAWGEQPGTEDNDGIVPTLSQPWGEVISAVWSDHLDIIGHFKSMERHPPHYDWLLTHSQFDRRTFEDTWERVVDFSLGTDRP